MYRLTCKCCEFTQDYDNLLDAEIDGWDTPLSFPSWPVSCPLCPGVCSMGMVDHSAAHERWDREGRPEEFSLEGLAWPPDPADLRR